MTTAADKVHRWLNPALALLYPEVCQLCKAEPAGPREGYVGAKCWSQVRFIRQPFCERCGLPFEGDITTSFVCSNCSDVKFYFCSARSVRVFVKGSVLEK